MKHISALALMVFSIFADYLLVTSKIWNGLKLETAFSFKLSLAVQRGIMLATHLASVKLLRWKQYALLRDQRQRTTQELRLCSSTAAI